MAVQRDAIQDNIVNLLVSRASGAPTTVDHQTAHAAKCVVMDSIAVALGALRHRAAQAGRRYAYQFATTQGCALWGTDKRATPEVAALANGVLLRCYDYNDLVMGRQSGGHPSDMVAGLVAAAEWKNASGSDLIGAIVLAYDIALDLFDTVALVPGGWDYANLTAIAACCGIGRRMGLD
ncbi:MAG: MmgE/PrpD family protein, partial [Rhizomicrobium sp.]